MRIAMLADAYKPHISGITRYIELNKSLLEKAGHEVYVFTFGDEDYQDTEERVIRSPGLPLVENYYFSFQYSRRAKALLQTMDVIHVHHPFLSGRMALHYGRPLNIPLIFTNHTRYDLYAQAYIPGLPEELSESFLTNYMPNFCAAMDGVISPSAGMAAILRRLNVKTPIAIVPNGVDLSLFEQDKDPNIHRASLGLSEKEIILIYSGRLAREKNLPFLLQAFEAVALALNNVHLLLLGDGPERAALSQQAAASAAPERVHFLGQAQYQHIPAYLRLSDIFVTTSVSEVHPLSVIEAMAAGLPVVGIQSVGVGDTVRDGETGLLAPDNLAAFSAKLTRLCMDANLRKKMSAAASLTAQQYDIRRTSQIMLELYQNLVKAHRIYKPGLVSRLRRFASRFKL